MSLRLLIEQTSARTRILVTHPHLPLSAEIISQLQTLPEIETISTQDTKPANIIIYLTSSTPLGHLHAHLDPNTTATSKTSSRRKSKYNPTSRRSRFLSHSI